MGKPSRGFTQDDPDRDRGPNATRIQGVIKRLVHDKGFGFIKDESSALEYFFHQSGLMAGTEFHELVEGDRVEFVAGRGPKGPRAEGIRIAPIT